MTITSCYSGELHQGHQYYLMAGNIRIPVWVPPGIPNGQYSSAVISGHAVRFWVGEASQCGGGGFPVATGVLLGLLLVVVVILWSVFRHRPLPPDGHPIHQRPSR